MSDPALAVALGAAALAAALLWLALRTRAGAAPGARGGAPGAADAPAPPGWRLVRPVVEPVAALIDPWLPRALRRAAGGLLRRADLDRTIDPARLSALVAVCAAIAAGATSALLAGLPWLDPSGLRQGAVAALAALAGGAFPLARVRDRAQRRRRAIVRALPFALDVIVLAVEAGANVTGALQHAVDKGAPGPLRSELDRVLRDVRTGRSRADALHALADRVDLPAVRGWVAALVAAERQGSSLGPILRAQAEQRRDERFQAAEKLAATAPVRLLLPLLLFMFPCTFVLLFFPVVVRLIQEGVL